MEETKLEEKQEKVVEKKEKKSVKEIAQDIFGFIWDTTFFLLVLIMVFLFIRFEPRYIETGSMRPGISIGALVLVDDRAYTDNDPEVGDIAMYKTEGGREVIHRIIDVTEDGEYVFKGDNNNSEDFSPVDKTQIEGKVKFTCNLIAPLIRAIKHLNNI